MYRYNGGSLCLAQTLYATKMFIFHTFVSVYMWGGVPSFKELVGSRCDPGESSCWELAGCLPGGGGVHIYECECAPAVGVWVRIEGFWGGGVAGSVGKYSQKACTLVFPTSLHLQKKKKKCRAEKSHPQRQVWLHTLLPQCVGGTAAEHSPFLTCVTPN